MHTTFRGLMLGASLLACAAFAAPANAEGRFLPAIVYDMGGKFDKSFNEAAYNGIEKFKKDTGVSYLDFEIANDTQREQAMRRMAQKGADPVIAIGFTQAAALAKVAAEFPKTRFAIVDTTINAPNVQSVVFRDQEGSFLAGMLASLTSKSGKVGFIGGMDVPVIRRFLCGYEQGARFANPRAEVLSNMAGTTPAAWSDPTRGAELARTQFSKGVDVVFAAAGGTGIGVYQAAKDQGKLAIGVDSNQNGIHPGTMLTSMMKRLDVAVYATVAAARDGSWKPGTVTLGLKEKGVELAMDANNGKLVPPAVQAKLAAAEADIVAGRIKVANYMADNSCHY